MKTIQTKLGRNDPCSCGSGRKYKKCCLSEEYWVSSDPTPLSEIAWQKSEQRFKQRLQNTWGDKCTMLKGQLEVKMSEVILHLAEELLEYATSKQDSNKAITVTCAAWNLAIFPDEKQQKEINNLIAGIDDEQGKQDTRDIINAIIDKKNRYYPNIKRMIVDFDLQGDHNNLRLNIASTVPEEELQEIS